MPTSDNAAKKSKPMPKKQLQYFEKRHLDVRGKRVLVVAQKEDPLRVLRERHSARRGNERPDPHGAGHRSA